MKVALVNPPLVFSSRRQSALSQCLGLRTISACLKARGHQVTFLDALMRGFSKVRKYANGVLIGLTADQIAAGIPADAELIGLSAPFSQLAPVVHEIARRIRERLPGALLVMGGVYPSTQPELALTSAADCIVVGEGEVAMLELASGKAPAELQGVYAPGSPRRDAFPPAKAVEDLDSLPFADDAIPHVDRYFRRSPRMHAGEPTAAIVTSRGCPYDCEFCSVHPICGRKWRARSAGNVLDEIAYLSRRRRVRRIEIEDDNFTLNPSRAMEILEGIVRLNEQGAGLSWTTPNGVRIETLTADLIRLMRASNCAEVALGLEHGDEEMLRLMNKGLDLQRAFDVIRGLVEAGIPRITLFLIVGYPGESRERFQRGLEYLRAVRALGGAIAVCVNFAQPYPGTDLLRRCLEEGIIADRDFGDFLVRKDHTNTAYFVQIETPDFDAAEVLRRRREICDVFAPSWKRAVKKRLPAGLLQAARKAKRWVEGHP
jgi:radical SAM superfamily enzyme YgiQ (UPF0313 family)